ncbi:nucleotide exchange factor GrpE [Candidatus Gracilibacteria bacterium]|nr:nucleotide exchange factor GrpE [Candidatus Gracilibacteria bacterium]
MSQKDSAPSDDTETDELLEEILNPDKEEVDASGEEIIRLQESLARSQADYQNLLMRVERDKSEMAFFLASKLMLPLLSQVDNLERAVKLKEGVEGDSFVDGVRSVLSAFIKYLESQGVTGFDSIGHEVDPDRHDVMTEMSGEAGKIIQEFEKGYLLKERVLRHAKVVVGNGN